MGKTSEAAVYRKFINTMKKKTKKMNEDVKRDEYGDPVGGPKISKKQKAKNLAKNTPDEQHTTTTSEAANPAQQAAIAINMKKKGKKPKDMSEEGLRDWFGKSSGTTKSGRRVRGWVQVGGKYDGKPCARQPGQKTTPKCVSSAKRRSMSKDERDSARRRKVAADPGQPQKTGAAKPTMVSTDPKKKMKENVSFAEAKDKKGKGSGTKDACYHKVKSRYSVWPSAYASGALVKCRKVGAANWGNSTKEEFVKDGISFQQFQEKCWKGYEKKGMKTMFGKRYPNCVKKKTKSEEVEFQEKLDLKKADMGDVVKDFYKSDAPQFKGRSKEKRREMAIAAKLTAERGKLPEAVNAAQQAAIAIAKKERKQDLKVAQKKKMKEEVVTELNRFEKEKGVDTKTGKPVTKGGTAKNDKAFQFVMKKFGKQRVGANQPKKVRGAKNPNETSPTKQKMTRMKAAKASSRAFETRAKKAGYKTAQDYANVVARYGSEDNMKKGRGLGT